LLIDLALLFYILILWLIDSSMYRLVLWVERWTKLMSSDLLPGQSTMQDAGTQQQFMWVSVNASGLVDNLRVLMDQLSKCAPKSSPVEWAVYEKCFKFLGLLMFFSLFQPYIKRTRPYICTKLFPQLVRP